MKKAFIIVGVFFLACFVQIKDIQAQPKFHSILSSISAAEVLNRMLIDTTNITLIRRIADSSSHVLTDDAILFLAQHGDNSILPLAISRFNQSLQDYRYGYPHAYILSAIIALEGRNEYSYVVALIDSMIIHDKAYRMNTNGNGLLVNYQPSDFVDIIELLLDFGDVSQYELFKGLFKQRDWQFYAAIHDFYWFVQLDPSKDEDAFGLVKAFLSDTNENCRYEAVKTLHWFTNHPERIETYSNKSL